MAIKNKIIEGYLADFKDDFGINETNDDIAFEKFVNYCIISRIHPEAFSSDISRLEDLNIGGSHDTGIDGLGIIVNEHLVTSIDEVDAHKNYMNRLDVQFVFIQAKTSDEFKAEKVATFIFGVKDFFRDTPSIKFSENIQEYREIKDHIYKHSIEMDIKPKCLMYYVTTGKWVNDTNVMGRANSEKSDLERLNIFSSVEFIPVDADNIESIYRELKNKITKEILFEKRAVLPKMSGVTEAYIGILPISEYIKLISTSDNKIQKNLFYDNVRDFLGGNPVNSEIASTIRDSSIQDRFAILNNGVTIVSKSVHQVGDAFKIKDFQIVNGCQTSHVLFNNKNYFDNSLAYIPIKLIVTDDYEVANQITKATNRQTEVKVEAFASLEPYHRKLESFYNSFPRESKIYYERRPRQYDNSTPPIKKGNIITLASQINSFLSMFLNEPQSTHRYYGELLRAYEDKLFKENDNPFMYYVSAYALHAIDKCFKYYPQRLPAAYRRFKYHLLLIFRIMYGGYNLPGSSNQMSQYCERLHSILLNSQNNTADFRTGCHIIDSTIEAFKRKHPAVSPRDYHRNKSFTNEMIEQAKRHQRN